MASLQAVEVDILVTLLAPTTRSATRGSRARSLRIGPDRSHGEAPGTIEAMATEPGGVDGRAARAQTLAWLRENLPAGWIEAVDAGDTDDASSGCAPASTTTTWCIRARRGRGTRRPRGRPSTAPGSSLAPGAGARGERGARPLPGAAPVQHPRHRDGRPDGDRVGHRGAEAPLPPGHRHQRGDLVPAVQRAGRGLRRRRARARAPSATATSGWSTARRCGRRSRHVAQVRDARRPHRSRPAEAPRAQLLRRRHARSPASRCGRCVQITGDAEFNEVFFDRRAHPRRVARSGPMGDGWRVAHHHADERAGVAVGCRARWAATPVGGSPVQRADRPPPPGRRPADCASGSAQAWIDHR